MGLPDPLFTVLDKNARVSRDMLVNGLPFWEVYVDDMQEFAASHKGWLLQPALVWFLDSGNGTLLHGAAAEKISKKIVAAGGMEQFACEVARFAGPSLPQCSIPLGFHILPAPDDSMLLEAWILFAVDPSVRSSRKDLLSIEVPSVSGAHVMVSLPVSVPLMPVGSILHASALVNSHVHCFNSLDGVTAHQWLHDAFYATLYDDGSQSLNMRCFTADPVFVAVASLDPYCADWLAPVACDAMVYPSKDLSAAGNDYRLLASTLFNVGPDLLEDAVKVMLDF